MATNEVYRDAEHLSLTVPADTASGAPLRLGGATGLNVVTQTAEGEGGNAALKASVWTGGAHRFSVTGAVTTELQPIYITSGNALNVTASGNTLFGLALTLKAGAGAGDVVVKIVN